MNKKDFRKYPKTILADLNICKKNKVDYVYLPSKKDIYPEKKIIINAISQSINNKITNIDTFENIKILELLK